MPLVIGQHLLISLKSVVCSILACSHPCSRLKLIQMFLQMEKGTHINVNCGLQIIDCAAYRLEPLGDKRRSYNDLDGERIESGIVEGRILPSAAQFFSGSAILLK